MILRCAGLATSVVVLLTTAAVAAETTSALSVILEVADGQAPEYLCIVTTQSSCRWPAPEGPGPAASPKRPTAVTPSQEPSCAGQLSRADVEAALDLENLEERPGGTLQRWRQEVEASSEAALDTKRAFVDVARGRSDSCAAVHGACQPRLPGAAHGPPTFFRCGRNQSSIRGRGVAFVSLNFVSLAAGGLEEVHLRGSTADLFFEAGGAASMQVLGGSFAATTTTSAVKVRSDEVGIRLQPICVESSIQLPPRAPTVALQRAGGVTITKPEARTMVSNLMSPVPTTCDPGPDIGSSFTAFLPYVEGGRKKIVVKTITSASMTDGELEATWTTAAPPSVLALGYRQLEVTWTKQCAIAELEPTDLAVEVRDGDGGVVASTACPRVTLVAAGAPCTLVRGGEGARDRGRGERACGYVCRAPDGLPPFSLPSPVSLARFLTLDDREEQIAAWSDTLRYAGQELVSYVPAGERDLVVVLDDPARWRSRHGDRISAIEVDVAGELQRIAIGGAERSWFTIAAPGLDCRDAVRMHIAGTRAYVTSTLPTTGGVLILEAPWDYRIAKRIPFKIGVALGVPLRQDFDAPDGEDLLIGIRVEPMVVAGVGLESYTDWPAPGAWELGVDYHLGRRDYQGIELGPTAGHQRDVWYQRIGVKVGWTWWRYPRGHFGGGLGAGLGTPLLPGDRREVGTTNPYLALEAWGRYTPRLGTAWIELAPELRIGEARRHFRTDFQGQPTLELKRSIDLSVAVRVRFGGS